MAHNRAQLNALIFHNPVILPPTSPGYAEMTIAVAELQGGNCAKAALYAEAAVTKDPTLAAGWLAKTAADVFEATPGDLRQERALFCMDRALERAPSCRREIIEFFVANILGHYVEVLCAGSQEELTQWFQLEAHAGELEDNARMLNWETNQLHGEAALLQATGLVTGSVALFSRRIGTQVFAGVASVAAFSEAARRTNNATLLEGMAAELPRVGYTLRLEGNEHRTASMGYLVPARDLIGVAARLLQAEGLPPQPLDRLIHAFTFSFRQVLANHLLQLNRQLNEPMFYAIGGDANSLAATYHTHPGPIATRGARDAYAGPHPASRDTLLWLEHMVPGVRRLEAYQLLSNPMPTISERVYGFYRPRLGASLPKRMDDAYKMHTAGPMGCLAVATLACVFLLPPLGIVLGVLSIICAFQSLTRRRSRTRLQSLADSLWSVDTWLGTPRDSVLSQSGTLTGNWHQGPPLLTVGAQVGKSASRTAPSTSTIILRVCVSLVILFFALVLL